MDETSTSKTGRQIERKLEADLSCARREFERASREFSLEVGAIGEIPPQDGIVNLENARQQVDLAHNRYRKALQSFTEFAAHGTVPVDHSQPTGENNDDSRIDSASA